MEQVKFYKYGMWALLFLNVSVLTFFVFTKPRPPHHPPMNDFKSEVVNILKLSDQQTEKFNDLAEEHKMVTTRINETQLELLGPYFEEVAESSAMTNDSLLIQYQQLEKDKMEVTRRHLLDVKKLLNEEQMSYFRRFTKIFTERVLMSKDKGPRPPRRK